MKISLIAQRGPQLIRIGESKTMSKARIMLRLLEVIQEEIKLRVVRPKRLNYIYCNYLVHVPESDSRITNYKFESERCVI